MRACVLVNILPAAEDVAVDDDGHVQAQRLHQHPVAKAFWYFTADFCVAGDTQFGISFIATAPSSYHKIKH